MKIINQLNLFSNEEVHMSDFGHLNILLDEKFENSA